MSVSARKICLIGDFGVGKTSLVRRFVKQTFSDEYITTVGVKVDTKVVKLSNNLTVKLAIWDIAGRERLTPVVTSYLKGSGGVLLVGDGSRSETLASLKQLSAQVVSIVGDVPIVAMINKSDLKDKWPLSASQLVKDLGDIPCKETSALTGINVEESFKLLSEMMMQDRLK